MKQVDPISIIGRRVIIAVPMTDEFREILDVSEFPAWNADSGGVVMSSVRGTSQIVVVLDINKPDLAIHLLFSRIMDLVGRQPRQSVTLYDHVSYRHLYPILPRCIEIVCLEKSPNQLTLL